MSFINYLFNVSFLFLVFHEGSLRALHFSCEIINIRERKSFTLVGKFFWIKNFWNREKIKTRSFTAECIFKACVHDFSLFLKDKCISS